MMDRLQRACDACANVTPLGIVGGARLDLPTRLDRRDSVSIQLANFL